MDPNIKTLTAKDIDDTIACVEFFKEIKKKEKNEEIFNLIKEKLNENLIRSFENYSEIYTSINELNQNFEDFSLNLYDKVEKIVKDTEIIFLQNNEEITIKESNETKDKNPINSIEDLIILKNKIHVKQKIDENDSENENKMIKKNNTLNFFKEIINNIETIYEHISVLKIKYFLNDKNNKAIEKNFDEIEKFLSNAKKDLIKQLETFYKIDDFMRFFYGKQIVSIVDHLDGYLEIFPFLRYILNDTDKENIEEGDKKNVHSLTDYINHYSLYNKETFENISNYVISLLKKNKTSLEEHYTHLKIRSENTLKGIYIYKSESESMEEDILQIFLDKINRLPIAQNILITNKETSYEEMQAFLNRAILCRYNTLFAFEINESFSLDQQRDLNKFIDKLLSYKNEYFNKIEKNTIPKENTSEYMDSCLVFVYNEKSESSLNYIRKVIVTKELTLRKIHSIDNSTFIEDDSKNDMSNSKINNSINASRCELNNNVHVIKSEICGLGKTEKIRKEIKEKKKEYIHFPIGGNINRDILYNKLKIIIEKIEKIKKEKKINVAIHLDLYDNNEPSILNEFLFSFLITKFYSNSENIIYISKDIEIFVEVPNCFEDFISKYKILNSFDIDNIEIDKKPELNLSDERSIFFENMLNTKDNKKFLEFINNNIGIEKYSYHQLNIFINLFIGQYRNYNKTGESKLTFYRGDKVITKEVIENFGKCTKYFTSGAFANLLVDKDKMNKINGKNKEYLKLLGQIYENDLYDYDVNNNNLDKKDLNDKFKFPLFFLKYNKEQKKGEYRELYISKNNLGLREIKQPEEKNSEYFLTVLNEILDLSPSIESLKKIIDEDEYIITNDNFRKMVLIIYRIIANIPVILMGETGCGKTALIKKLSQLLNNGKNNLEIINIHPGISDNYLIKKMKEINIKAKNTNEDIWVFFDELNTCDSFAILTEIFANRSFEGENLSNNIKIIGACNPYRIREENKVKCGLSHPDDKFDELVYLVKLMPQSLMYYVFNFGSINEEDESKYIKSIISKHFNNDEEKLKEETKNVISSCHKFLRKKFDLSVVSLREISRF